MRHKYSTEALVLARTPLSEAGMLITLLTPELGLIRARAEGLRRSGAKLAHALQTFNETDVMLVRGKEGWRLTGAILSQNRFSELTHISRMRAARVAGLLLRLVHGESSDPLLHAHFREFMDALPMLTPEEAETAESLVVMRLLSVLGFDAGDLPPDGYGTPAHLHALEQRSSIIARINRGIAAAGV